MATAVRRLAHGGAEAWRSVPMCESGWGPRYLQARRGKGLLLLRVSINLLDGNPLGIEDSDLPLYSRGSGRADGQASVISTYFLADRGGLAKRADRLSALRGRLQLRDRLADRNHVVEANARQTATAQRYGDPILEICGAHRGWERPNTLATRRR